MKEYSQGSKVVSKDYTRWGQWFYFEKLREVNFSHVTSGYEYLGLYFP